MCEFVSLSHRGAITSTAAADFPTTVQFDAVSQINSASPDAPATGGVAGIAAAAAVSVPVPFVVHVAVSDDVAAAAAAAATIDVLAATACHSFALG